MHAKTRLLLLEDDAELLSLLHGALNREGYLVDIAASIPAFQQALERLKYDLVVMDRMIGQDDKAEDALEVLKEKRAAGDEVLVLVLTARTDVEDRVEALNFADDYLGKPFEETELLARVRSLLRRRGRRSENLFEQGPLLIDRIARTVHVDGVFVPLSPTETNLMIYFADHAGQILTKRMLLEKVWNIHFDPSTNVVEANVSRLRKKLEAKSSRRLIENVRARGYRLHL
jgi:two-component system OmpR family response regulator